VQIFEHTTKQAERKRQHLSLHKKLDSGLTLLKIEVTIISIEIDRNK
jgi:hypothetical protein